jgi:hypothetical protein
VIAKTGGGVCSWVRVLTPLAPPPTPVFLLAVEGAFGRCQGRVSAARRRQGSCYGQCVRLCCT